MALLKRSIKQEAKTQHVSCDRSTWSAERATGPPLGWTAGEAFCVGALEGVCGCGWGVESTAGLVSGAPFSGILWKQNVGSIAVRVSITETASHIRVQSWLTHPVWSVNGGQSVQVCHRELQAALPEVVVHVHHATQRGSAAEGIGPWLQGGHGNNAWWERWTLEQPSQNKANIIIPVRLGVSHEEEKECIKVFKMQSIVQRNSHAHRHNRVGR